MNTFAGTRFVSELNSRFLRVRIIFSFDRFLNFYSCVISQEIATQPM
ncbi:hypothetical protein HanXRQr2_Chr03g0091021 [Helianthus annuus]|uniref:Uncharacterized protein n=1 Tax=Helianthus annuus TaxID=4232 RepID=A0A9K3NUW7_HELAN|nr:hypothetical protein HanXRQr2_Chr03g0091021 [Helianthus annuus]